VPRIGFALPRASSRSVDLIVWDPIGAVAGGARIGHWRGGFLPADSVKYLFYGLFVAASNCTANSAFANSNLEGA
jgi:hypothetical protein